VIFRFDSFELDTESFVLSASGSEVPVQPRALDVLIHLIRNRHRLVDKEELLAGPWGGAAVTDTAIHQALLLVRRALADTGAPQRFVKTIRGKGFRFIATVSVDERAQAQAQRTDETLMPR